MTPWDKFTSMSGARISECDRYRYALWRQVNCYGFGYVLFIGLNPSTADARSNDNTIRRMMAYACAWGFKTMFVCNLFALRSKNPGDLRECAEPIGTRNDETITEFVQASMRVVCCWGAHGSHLGRDRSVVDLLTNPQSIVRTDLYCLGRTKAGDPRHPLYLKKETPLEPYLALRNIVGDRNP